MTATLFVVGQEIRFKGDKVNSPIKRQNSKILVFISRRKLKTNHRLFCFVFLVLVSKQWFKKVWASPHNQKCPFCTLASKSNVTLAQALRLKILQYFTWKSLSGDRRLYLHARK